MPEDLFSQSVLAGLQLRGVSLKEVGRFTGLSEAKLTSILQGHANFTDAHLAAIEDATASTAGELAMLTIKRPGKAFASIMQTIASARHELRDSSLPLAK